MVIENTHLVPKGKYPCAAYRLFYWFGFNQASKSIVIYNVSNTKL